MPAKTTRTLNPLPFQNLEPHRFEDLVRQLAYDLRRWKSLEATGRGGSDDGIDIRGLELVEIDSEVEVDENGEHDSIFQERLWIFQCKRQKTLTPKEMKSAIDESLSSLPQPPHGFVIAIACDVSKKARDVFRGEMVARGIQEFFIWANGELEDLLFQAKNDRLLFAYFGLSLQPRRQNIATAIRSKIATRKKIAAIIDEESRRENLVLLRDIRDEDYPHRPNEKDERPKWLLCQAVSAKNPEGLTVMISEHLAAINSDGSKWDAILEFDTARDYWKNELQSKRAWSVSDRHTWRESPERDFWSEFIPEDQRCTLKVYRWVPYDRMLAVDPAGDGYYPIPHIFVDFDDRTGPFMKGKKFHLQSNREMGRIDLEATDDNRTSIFPKPIPKDLSKPPKEFDQTIQSKETISDPSREKLQQLMNSFSQRRDAAQKISKESTTNREKNPLAIAFQEWRKSIALPVLSSLALGLRREGHESRVVTTSNDPESTGRYLETIESIELRIKIGHGGSTHNPDYKPTGYLKISLSQHRGLLVDAWPKEESKSNHSYGSKPAASTPTLEQMDKAFLEAQVVAIIERMASDRV